MISIVIGTIITIFMIIIIIETKLQPETSPSKGASSLPRPSWTAASSDCEGRRSFE